MNVLHYKLRNLQCLMIVFDLSRTECSLRDEYFAWQTQKCSVRDDSGSFVPYPTWITTRGLNVVRCKLGNVQCVMIVFDLWRREWSLRDEYLALHIQKCSASDDCRSLATS